MLIKLRDNLEVPNMQTYQHHVRLMLNVLNCVKTETFPTFWEEEGVRRKSDELGRWREHTVLLFRFSVMNVLPQTLSTLQWNSALKVRAWGMMHDECTMHSHVLFEENNKHATSPDLETIKLLFGLKSKSQTHLWSLVMILYISVIIVTAERHRMWCLLSTQEVHEEFANVPVVTETGGPQAWLLIWCHETLQLLLRQVVPVWPAPCSVWQLFMIQHLAWFSLTYIQCIKK